MSFLINGQHFATKRAVAAHCAAILGRGTITDDEHAFLVDLLKRHPNHAQIIAPGFSRIVIGTNSFGDRSFQVERPNGKRFDFSYITCIRQSSAELEALAILREAIEPQLQAHLFKAVVVDAEPHCAVRGRAVLPKEAEVEHHPLLPLSALVQRFLASRGAVLTDLLQRDPKLLRAWQRFHKEHAVLRVIGRAA
jgi:hypothetical protein